MTGKHLGHAYIRDNAQAGPKAGADPGRDGDGGRSLKAAGYATGAMGKWGLGPPASSGDPNKQGFDLFSATTAKRPHNYYPTYLW